MPADTDRTQRLISELQRLFLLPGADDATVAALQRQLAGLEPAAFDLCDAAGRARLMALRFGGVARGSGAAQGAAALQLARTLMDELDWPEPALSVDGRDAFTLWLPLAEAVPVAQLEEFVRLLRDLVLPAQPALDGSPGDAAASAGGVPLPPGLHPDTGLWSVFIAPGLASSFSEEAGLDIPPNLDKQAELLARLEPASPDTFTKALERLRRQAAPAAGVAQAPDTAVPAQPGDAPSAAPAPAPSVPQPLAAQREELLRALSWPVAAVSTPFAGLTSLLHGGLRGGRFYALLAPPKSGKTTLAALALEHAAARGHAALYMGWEMAREQLIHAALARRLRLDAARIEARALAPDETARVAATLDAWLEREGRHLTLWEAAPGTALAEAAAWARRAAAADPGRTPLLVIDPMPLAATGVPAFDAHPDAARRLAALAAACKDLARASGAAVLALCPTARPVTSAAELESDPEARALWSTADGVLALQPTASSPAESPAEGDPVPVALRLSLLSHRGRTGTVALRHWPAFHAMEEAPAA